MLFRIQTLSSCLITLTVCLWAGLAGAGDVASKCEAAMDRAAGRYSKCLLGADARNAKKENASKLARPLKLPNAKMMFCLAIPRREPTYEAQQSRRSPQNPCLAGVTL